MKRLAMTAAILCGLGILAGPVWAQEGAGEPPDPKRNRKERPVKKKVLLRGMHAQMATVCGLSEQQQKSIADLSAKRREDLKPVMEKEKPLAADLKKAREAGNEEEVKRVRAERTKVRAERNKIRDESRKAILAVLTPEQKVKWDEYQFVLQIKGRYSAAKLTDEQIEKIKAAHVKVAAGVDMNDKEAKRAAMGKLHAMIEKDILTPAQRTECAVAKVARRYNRLKLSDGQKAQIRAAYLKSIAGVDMGDRKAVRAATDKLNEEIRADILTAEQRAKIKPAPARAPRANKTPPKKVGKKVEPGAGAAG